MRYDGIWGPGKEGRGADTARKCWNKRGSEGAGSEDAKRKTGWQKSVI